MPHDSESNTGGGSTFFRNFKNGLPDDIALVDSLESADLLFIPGVTLCDRKTVEEAKRSGKPVVTRVDNLPEDHRNRGTGISRLRDFSEWASVVVFQSNWSRHVTGQVAGTNGAVIYNGVDTKIFHPPEKKPEKDFKTFIYVKHSRNECKRFQEAQMLFREYARVHKAKLILVGRFEDALKEYGFGFFDGEDIEYMGVLDPYQLAEQYRRADAMLFPSFGDSCPNVVLEAMASGLPVLFNHWGGTKELVGECGVGIDYGSMPPIDHVEKLLEVDPQACVDRVNEQFTLEHMVNEYVGVFRVIMQNMGAYE